MFEKSRSEASKIRVRGLIFGAIQHKRNPESPTLLGRPEKDASLGGAIDRFLPCQSRSQKHGRFRMYARPQQKHLSLTHLQTPRFRYYLGLDTNQLRRRREAPFLSPAAAEVAAALTSSALEAPTALEEEPCFHIHGGGG